MAYIPVRMKAALDVYLRKRKFFAQYCSIYIFTAAKKDADVSSVGAGNFLGCKGYFAHIFLNLSEKLSLQMLFRFWYIIISSTKLPEACKQKNWNLKFGF